MAKLIALGTEPTQREEIEVSVRQIIRLGRAPLHGWKIPWELKISREHADLTWRDGRLRVRVLASARNPFEYQGTPSRNFALAIGEAFSIGGTRFELTADGSELMPARAAEVTEQAYDRDDLRKVRFADADQRLGLLAGLPQLIAGSRSDVDLAARLVDLLIEAIPEAAAAAVVVMPATAPPREHITVEPLGSETLVDQPGLAMPAPAKPVTIHSTCRNQRDPFKVSRQLVAAALNRGQSVLHVWDGSQSVEYTRSSGLDWAFCSPIEGDACPGWALYVSGRFDIFGAPAGNAGDSLQGHVRFTELLAQFIAAICQVRRLKERHAVLSRFFSPAVADQIVDPKFEANLDPKEGPVTVLFCDLHGFAQQAERSGSQLRAFLSQVSEALSVMTRSVLDEQGVIADFQGDAVLAFWGWPTPLADGPLAACRAALAIRERFAIARAQADPVLGGFEVGIGIAHGSAIAGKIGTDQQIKIGVFGPVVNLASRLQSLTRQIGVKIIIDPTTADFVRTSLPRAVGRQRLLAQLRPKGLANSVLVSELLPPAGPEALADQQIDLHDRLVAAFSSGNWSAARALCADEASDDGARKFLLAFMAEHGHTPPVNWDGVISLKEK